MATSNTILREDNDTKGMEIFIKGIPANPSMLDIRHTVLESGKASIHVETGGTLPLRSVIGNALTNQNVIQVE